MFFSKNQKLLRIIKTVLTGFILLLLAIFLKCAAIEFFVIPSDSMIPKLMPGDYVVVSRLHYFAGLSDEIPFTDLNNPFAFKIWWREPKRGDIAVFNIRNYYIESDAKTIVKRIVAQPGDTIEFFQDGIRINSTEFQSYQNYFIKRSKYDSPNFSAVVPKKGDDILMCDKNIWLYSVLLESQNYSIKENLHSDTLKIKAEEDYLFFMGDNRSESLDSRDWGFLPVNSIAGKPAIVYWSVDRNPDSERKLRPERIGIIEN